MCGCPREATCCAKTAYTNMYARQLERWFSFFRRDQFLIINSDTLKRNASDTLRRLGSFLDVSGREWSNLTIPSKNTGNSQGVGMWRMENVHPRTCQRMREAFQDHNRRLYELLEATASGAPKEQPNFPPFRCWVSGFERDGLCATLRALFTLSPYPFLQPPTPIPSPVPPNPEPRTTCGACIMLSPTIALLLHLDAVQILTLLTYSILMLC